MAKSREMFVPSNESPDDFFQGVEHPSVTRSMFLPRTALQRLGRLTAQGKASGEHVPLGVRNPVGHAALAALLGALGGGVVGGATGAAGLAAHDRNMKSAIPGGVLGSAVGAGVGALGGVVGSAVARSLQAKRLAADIRESGDMSPDAARNALQRDPKQARSSIMTALLFGTGAHQRGRLGAYAEMLDGRPDRRVSVLPDALNYVPYASLASVPIALAVDASKANDVESRLARLILSRAQTKHARKGTPA